MAQLNSLIVTGGTRLIGDATANDLQVTTINGVTVGSSPKFTDASVSASGNHYTPATVSGQDKTASASGATAAWSIDVVKGVTLNTDGKGHVTGMSVTSGKIPANPIPSNNVTGSGTSGYLVKFNGANTITSGPQLGSATTTYLRNDGTWVAPPNDDTKNTAGSTDTSSKIFLIGATSQAANPQTYSHDTAYVGTDGCLYSGGTKVLTAHQDISGKVNKSGDTMSGSLSLAYGASATMTYDSTNPQIGFSENGSQGVKIIYTDYDSYRAPYGLKVIGDGSASGNYGAWFETEGKFYSKGLNILQTGTGTTAQDKGSGVSPRYFPAKWTFNLGANPENGDQLTIKIPCAGHDYGVFLSTDNGTTYKPISVDSGTGRLTTHFGNGKLITLIYDSAGQTNSVYAAAGADARSNVTGGCWRVMNYYDTGNTYDRNRFNAAIKAWGTALKAGNIIVGIDGLYHHLKEGTAFDITYPILYLNEDRNASATSSNTYDILNFTITTTQSITLTAYKPVYIKGTLDGITFTPVSTTPLTQTIPSSADGYYYIFLGDATSTTAVYLTERHEIYAYKNGKFGTIVNDALSVNGYTVAKSVPSNAVFTDASVTAVGNHYTPATVSGQDKSASASGATAAWSIDVVKGVTLNTDGKGHVTGISVTSGKIPANPVASNTITGSGTSGYIAKFNGTNTITNGPAFGSATTTYLRNDGSWTTPDNTKNTAGSTDTSSKIFLIGATSQAANPQTYSDNEVYATSGVLTTKSVQVGGTAATMQYNSTNHCIDFVVT